MPGSVIAMAATTSPHAILGSHSLLLLLGAVGEEVVGHDAAVQRGAPGAVADAGLLLDEHGLVGEGAATSAVLLGDRDAEQTHLAGLAPQLAVDLLVLDETLDVGLDLLLAEGAGEIAEVVEVLVHPGRTAAGHKSSIGLVVPGTSCTKTYGCNVDRRQP